MPLNNRKVRQAASKNIITSLDMSLPAPRTSEFFGNWKVYLRSVIPFINIFLPSFNELQFMLKPHSSGIAAQLHEMTDLLLEFGATVIGIKLGNNGLYVRTTDNLERLSCFENICSNNNQSWLKREFIVPCRKMEVVGTTGAGDATVAGFLAGIVSEESLENTGLLAVGTGALSVSSHDSISNIEPLAAIKKKLVAEWKVEDISFDPEDIQIIR